jgi:hypothetical protein
MDNSVYLQKVFPDHIMEPLSSDWPTFYLDKSNYDRDLQVHCVILGHEWWGKDGYGMYGLIVTSIPSPKRTLRRIGMLELLPRFRSSDQGLDMRDVVGKKIAKAKEAIGHYMHESPEYKATLCSPYLRDGLQEKVFSLHVCIRKGFFFK